MDPSTATSPATIFCEAILFDMDGILISSIGSVERSWTRWAEMHGVDPAYAIRVIHGRRAIESVRAIRPDLDADKELVFLEQLEIDDQEGIQVLPGVCDLLKTLPPDRWTVVTSATERLARVRLEAAGLPVPHRFVHGDAVEEGKPHPGPFLAGAALLGFAPEKCVAIEDSASGVAAGRAAGCTVIATLFTHGAGELGGADYVVKDLSLLSVRPGVGQLEVILWPEQT